MTTSTTARKKTTAKPSTQAPAGSPVKPGAGKAAKPSPQPSSEPLAKPATKPVAKPAGKAATQPVAKAAAAAATGKGAKKLVKSRPVLVRDSFTMPESDFALIASLKAKALGARRAAKKSELLRAGLNLLAALQPAALVAALDALEPIKTGRPKKGH